MVSPELKTADADESVARNWSVDRLTEKVVGSVQNARVGDTPFFHLRLEHFFPDDLYGGMLRFMPMSSDYRAMSDQRKSANGANARATRTKIDLFPEYIRHFPPEKRAIWEVVGRALCSKELAAAFVQQLGPGLQRRFGENFAGVRMYPLPILTRDIPGYRTGPHTDSRWKGITVQLYLPPDNSTAHIGTLFHERPQPGGDLPNRTQVPFAPNSGYAFAVGSDTWHSVARVGEEVQTRDSILLTYFVDAGAFKFVRNRGRRIGNFVLNEMRNLKRS
jgi:hypothetical protein